MGYGFLTMRLMSSLKSDIVRTVLSFLGMINVGNAHLEDVCHFNTSIVQSRLLTEGERLSL